MTMFHILGNGTDLMEKRRQRPIETQIISSLVITYLITRSKSYATEVMITSIKFSRDYIDLMMDGQELLWLILPSAF